MIALLLPVDFSHAEIRKRPRLQSGPGKVMVNHNASEMRYLYTQTGA